MSSSLNTEARFGSGRTTCGITKNMSYLKLCFKQIGVLLDKIENSIECKEIISELLVKDDSNEIENGIMNFGEKFTELILKNENIKNNVYLRNILVICLEFSERLKNKKIEHLFLMKASIEFNEKIYTQKTIVVMHNNTHKSFLGVFNSMDAVRDAVRRLEKINQRIYNESDFIIKDTIINTIGL